jgi:predicted DNA-binding protein
LLYTALYMSATRTQVYLTAEQRRKLDELSARSGATLAELVRAAVDEYLTEQHVDLKVALDASFGSMPDLEVPSRHEWNRRPAD